MRDIEDLFKESLKDHQLPYSEEAWSKMNKKLDARSSGASNGLKWMLGSVGAILIVASYLFMGSDETPRQIQAEIIKAEEESVQTTKEKQIEAIEKSEVEVAKQQIEEDRSVHRFGDAGCCDDVVEESIVEEVNVKSSGSAELQQPVYREVAIDPIAKDEIKSPLYFAKPQDHCLNTDFSYSNVNDESIYLLSPLDDLEEIAPKESLEVILDKKGKYQIGTLNQDQEFEEFVSFKVHEPKGIQLTANDHLNYENGLPELNVQAFSDLQINWILNGEKTTKQSNFENFYLFDKGSYIVKATTKDINGCQSEDQVSFYVEKNYNLLAVNAFTPNSLDQRNTSFMPYALTKRDAAFKMIIIDPSNGAVIFETMNANRPWTGINKNTGEIVEGNKSYVWKVVLQNPENGESPEYMGTVVRL